ncbi:hypothetical protein LSAT2_016599, partial [Lamellibrachia satsuma]
MSRRSLIGSLLQACSPSPGRRLNWTQPQFWRNNCSHKLASLIGLKMVLTRANSCLTCRATNRSSFMGLGQLPVKLCRSFMGLGQLPVKLCRSFMGLGQLPVKLWDLVFGLLIIEVTLGFFSIPGLQEVSPVSLTYPTT